MMKFSFKDYNDILHWLVLEVKKNNCVFINLLQSSNCSLKCYTSNSRFIGIVFEQAIYCEDENIRSALVAELPKVRNELEKTNILNKMFSIIIPLLDTTFEKGDLGKIFEIKRC